MFQAEEKGLLLPIANHATDKCVSLYADHVTLFIWPVQELQITKEILECFGNAFGLQTDLQKSFVIPVRCGGVALEFSSVHHQNSLALIWVNNLQ